VNEKEANHPAHPIDKTANWCSHGGLVHCGHFSAHFDPSNDILQIPNLLVEEVLHCINIISKP
jgi:hypothetical protein